MIKFENVTKTFRSRGLHKIIADDINVVFPTGASVGLLGRNGAGKSSLLKIIAGTMNPDRGRITSSGSISWPVGFAGSFHPELTGLQNVRFLARIYGMDTDEMVDFVHDFAELGQHFFQPYRMYSSGMRTRLAFGASMAIPFDTYLVDEVTSVGDAAFRVKSDLVFNERLKNSSAVVVNHSMGSIRQICNAGAVLENGKLTYFPDVEAAIRYHEITMEQHAKQ